MAAKHVQRKSKLIVVSAPSGGGKTTICNALLKKDKKLVRSISATTRTPRGREKDGKDYYFITAKRFSTLIEKKGFIEWAKVHDNYYGTLRPQVNKQLKAGKDVLLVIDVQGGLQVKEQFPQAVLIFIVPPSMTVLEKRLTGRRTDEPKAVKKRLANARRELKQAKHYDYHVINDRLVQAIENVGCIIKAERLKNN